MFAYFTKMIGTNIITYTHDMGRLYFDEDDCDCGSSGSSDGSGSSGSIESSDSIESSTSGYEEMPPPFATQPSLIPPLFSYC
jgi:hypothetical protein